MSRHKEIHAGTTFGKWTVVQRVDNNSRGRAQYLCICDCGRQQRVQAALLRSGKSSQCFSCRAVCHEPIAPGERFGKWTVLHYERCSGNAYLYRCQCQCGREQEVHSVRLRSGVSTQCYSCRSATHYGSYSPEYWVWHGMVERCHNTSHSHYRNYGGRGIRVCDEWRGRGGFARFIAHMRPRPSSHHSVERIDNDRGYEPGNVRWATTGEQMRNTRRNRWLTIDGVTKTIRDWAAVAPVSQRTIRARLSVGWSHKEAVFAPPRTPHGGHSTKRRAA